MAAFAAWRGRAVQMTSTLPSREGEAGKPTKPPSPHRASMVIERPSTSLSLAARRGALPARIHPSKPRRAKATRCAVLSRLGPSGRGRCEKGRQRGEDGRIHSRASSGGRGGVSSAGQPARTPGSAPAPRFLPHAQAAGDLVDWRATWPPSCSSATPIPAGRDGPRPPGEDAQRARSDRPRALGGVANHARDGVVRPSTRAARGRHPPRGERLRLHRPAPAPGHCWPSIVTMTQGGEGHGRRLRRSAGADRRDPARAGRGRRRRPVRPGRRSRRQTRNEIRRCSIGC